MKKRILFTLIIMLLPIMVNAKETCTIVSGNGKDIGSEIACGSEHFYIIENNNNTIRMLSKYNLNIGYTYYRVEIEDYGTCDGVKPSNAVTSYTKKVNNVYYCYYATENWTNPLQNELAVGAHGNTPGESDYPEVAIVPLWNTGTTNYLLTNFGDTYSVGYKDGALKEESNDGSNGMEAIKLLNTYKNDLNNSGYNITNIDLISVTDLNNIYKSVSGKELPLQQWYQSSTNNLSTTGDFYYHIGDLKEHFSNDYKWLWSTTYWTKTVEAEYVYYQYFVDTLGFLCNGRECYNALGAGIRPVITITNSDIRYLIRTKTDGKGTIEVVESAAGGDSIQFKVKANKSYKLAGLTVTTDAGETVEFNEGDFEVDSSGVYRISTNKFTMPFDNVTIQARWTIINPNTGMFYCAIVIILLGIGISTYLYNKKSLKNSL